MTAEYKKISEVIFSGFFSNVVDAFVGGYKNNDKEINEMLEDLKSKPLPTIKEDRLNLKKDLNNSAIDLNNSFEKRRKELHEQYWY